MKAFPSGCYNRVIALAAALQAASAVESLANEGKTDSILIDTQLQSVFCLHPKSVIAIYQDEAHLFSGLHLLTNMLDQQHGKKYQRCMHYLMALLHLSAKLLRNRSMCQQIYQGLERIERQAKHFSLVHPTVVHNLAELYSQTISRYSFRIHVVGKQQFLQQPGIMDLIRALLLSGIRAGILWQQVGGKRWQFIFARRQLHDCAQTLLASLKENPNYVAPRSTHST